MRFVAETICILLVLSKGRWSFLVNGQSFEQISIFLLDGVGVGTHDSVFKGRSVGGVRRVVIHVEFGPHSQAHLFEEVGLDQRFELLWVVFHRKNFGCFRVQETFTSFSNYGHHQIACIV